MYSVMLFHFHRNFIQAIQLMNLKKYSLNAMKYYL